MIYLGFYWLFWRYIFGRIQLRGSSSDSKIEESSRHPAYDWPISGPIAKLGHRGLTAIAVITSLLSSFNPFQAWQQIRQLVGQAKISKRIEGKEAQIQAYQNKTSYRLPFEGQWLIYNGGLSPATSHSWDVLTQRYAYDFVIADDKHKRHNNRGNKLTDYFCYRAPIVAAADGEVVSVFDKTSDAPFVGYCFIDFLARHFAGNHIIIKHAEGEYGFYAHLIKGSIPLKVGDKVKQGALVGLCGHTGHSSEPHLHFHLQDRAEFFDAMGLPIRFEGIEVDGEMKSPPTKVIRGQRVSNPDKANGREES